MRDVEDPERAIRMDFGNYTIGHLVSNRQNYDFRQKEYVGVRKQIADRMRRLGYSTELFGSLDRSIAMHREYRRDGYKVDRYGKKYSWIAYFEMYGLRRAEGKFKDEYHAEPRPSDSDVDPSFPSEVPRWRPPSTEAFRNSSTDLRSWLAEGGDSGYVNLLRLRDVDGARGEWLLLDASMHEGPGDDRELRGWVTSVFATRHSVERMREEVESGRNLAEDALPESAADFYTYHGEVPWSENYGSDVRTSSGVPKLLSDRAFDYFDGRWRRGIRVEAACRRWSWESHHSELNQVGGVVFPAPPIANTLKLRVVGGSSDMVDDRGRLATLFRRTDGPGYGSHFLYMRRDLVDRYLQRRGLGLVQVVFTERNVSYRVIEHGLPSSLAEVLQSGLNRSGVVVGLEP